jgi:AraC-like DNA-binding protein
MKNFYQYINDYRVKEFIEKVSNPDNHKHTLIALAYDSGFNSKSAFYTTFKRSTGMTPLQFQKKIFKEVVQP